MLRKWPMRLVVSKLLSGFKETFLFIISCLSLIGIVIYTENLLKGLWFFSSITPIDYFLLLIGLWTIVLFIWVTSSSHKQNKSYSKILVFTWFLLALWAVYPTSNNNLILHIFNTSYTHPTVFYLQNVLAPLITLTITLLMMLSVAITATGKDKVMIRKIYLYFGIMAYCIIVVAFSATVLRAQNFWNFLSENSVKSFVYNLDNPMSYGSNITKCQGSKFYMKITHTGSVYGYCPPKHLDVKGEVFQITKIPLFTYFFLSKEEVLFLAKHNASWNIQQREKVMETLPKNKNSLHSILAISPLKPYYD